MIQAQIIIDRFLRSDLSAQYNLNVYERMILVILASYAGTKSDCFPSHLSLATNGGMSVDSVKSYTKSLEEKGLVKVLRSCGVNNHYQLTIPSADSTRSSQHPVPATPPTLLSEPLVPSADSTTNNISNNISECTSDMVISRTDFLCSSNGSIQKNCPHSEIIALYHEILPMCPEVRIWNKIRQTHLRQRWKESPERQNLKFWCQLFEHVKKSQFLIGQKAGHDGKPPFLTDLEWIIKPNNFAKIIEGKYHREESL